MITFHCPHHFTLEEVSQAEQAGNQIALALRNFQQSTEIAQRIRESSALEARGYRLLQAANGHRGVEVAETQEVDLILLDFNLPDIDGYEVAHRLRNSTKISLLHIPIIALTANALKGAAEKALAAGCDVYMSKPMNIRE